VEETMSRHKLTKSEIVEHLQRIADGDEPPTTAEFDADPESPSSATAYRLFSGGWKDAVREAGLDVRVVEENHAEQILKQEIIDHIQRLADGDEPPSSTEFDDDPNAPAQQTARKRFENGWKGAVKAAGFDTSSVKPTYSESEMLNHIQRLADGDDPPTRAEVDADPEAPASDTIHRNFEGGWKGAVKTAGFDVSDLSKRTGSNYAHNGPYTQSEIIEHIQRLSEDGVAPPVSEIKRDSDAPCASTVYNNFENGWVEAVKQAGLEPKGKRPDKIDREDILNHIQRLAEDGIPPRTTEFDERDDTPSVTTARSKFDCGWPGIVRKAGFTDDW
jgi:hypothetical protein